MFKVNKVLARKTFTFNIAQRGVYFKKTIMPHSLQSCSIAENPNILYPAKKRKDSTEMNVDFLGQWSRIGLTEAHQPAPITFSLLHSQTTLYFRDLYDSVLATSPFFHWMKKKVIHNPPNKSVLFVLCDKAKGSIHNLKLHSLDVNGFVRWSNAGRLFTWGQLRDPERRQHSWILPHPRETLSGWAPTAFHPVLYWNWRPRRIKSSEELTDF